MTRLRSVLLNILLLLVSLGAGLVLLEAGAWLVHPLPSPYSLPRDALTAATGVWTLTPNLRGVMDNRVDFTGKTVTADERGVRRSIPPAAGGPERRIFVLGDSQTFGHGLNDDETWPSRLQQALDARQPGARVENWGVPAINIDQYAARLDRVLAEAAEGDRVLVGVSWNDLITPPSVGHVMRVIDGYLVTAPRPDQPLAADPDPATAARVRLYDYTGLVVPPFQNLKQFAEALAANSALASIVVPRLRTIWHRWRPTTPITQIVDGRIPEANFALLGEMKRRAEAKGVALAVVLLPERHFVIDDIYRAYSGGGRFFPEQNFMGYLAGPLCRAFAIVCLDPFPILAAHQADPVYFRVDGHYNTRGAALIGAFVAERLAAAEP